MKKLYTSNYARNSKHPKALGISANRPFFYKGPMYMDLAPTWDFLKEYKAGIIDEREYTRRYLLLLKERNLDPQKIVDDLEEGTVLLCYESPAAFCHRHIVAIWLMKHVDVLIKELTTKS